MKPLYPFELGRLAGVSTDTLRYYDRRGLLPNVQRSKSGYRLFPVESLNRVRLVRRALSIGFSINELTDILRERDHGGAPCQRVRKLAAEKLISLEDRLRELQSQRRMLRSTLAGWDRILSRTARGQRAVLLERWRPKTKRRHDEDVNGGCVFDSIEPVGAIKARRLSNARSPFTNERAR